MVQYILECIAFQLLFLIIYDLFLKRETFFQWNRLYLIGTYLISMILPWVKIEAMKTTVPESFQAYPEFLWQMNDGVVVTNSAQEAAFSISWEYALLFGGMFLATLFFGYKLFQIYALKQKGEVHYFKDFTQIIVANSSVAFSFFKSIFLGDQVIQREHQNILQHELVHIRQRHSYDLIFFELMRVVGWFNPLVYVYQSRVSELHEFIADAHVAKTNKKEQYELLLSEVFQTQHISFINQFFKTSLIKKRIVMLQKTKSKKILQLKYLLLLPLVFGMLAYTSIEVQDERFQLHEELLASDEIIEVNDIENLNKEEKNKIFKRLYTLSKSSKDWLLTVKDKRTTMKFVRANNGSYLSGPNGEKIEAKLVYDSSLSEESKLSITEFLIKNGTTNLEAQRVTDHDNELIPERKKLNESFDDPPPIIDSLDRQLKALKASLAQELETIPFAKVNQVPVFPGCENEEDQRACFQKSIQRHISKNFRYPEEAQKLGLQGRVAIMFTMNTEGNIVNIKTRGPHKLLEDEALRIISRIPNVQSGEHKGKKVNVPFSIPITFKLTNGVDSNRASISKNYDDATDVPFATVDEVPVFPGCEGDSGRRDCFRRMLQQHISMNFSYPKEAEKKGIQGRVSIMFTISKDGSIQKIRKRGPDELLENEAVRIISLLPKMTPGKQKGKAVNVPFSIPITFKLTNGVDSNRASISKNYDNATDVPFAVVDEVPVFPGCEGDTNQRDCFSRMMQKHISKNFRYPQEAQKNGIQGRVSIMFTVSKDGSIQNVRMRGPDTILEKEAARIIGLLPKMIPGKHKGKAARVPYSIPITFRLQGDSDKIEDIKLRDLTEADPLIIIDGVESLNTTMNDLDATNIKSVTVLKDKAAIKKYGDKGKNGVVIIETIKEKKD